MHALGVLLNLTVLVAAATGRYENPEYGYAVQIPGRLPAQGETAPNPQHGVRITLAADAFVWVDASFNTTETPSLRAVLDDVIVSLKEAHAVDTVTRTPARLGPLSAESAVIRYRAGPGAPPQVREMIVALRKARPPGIVYTVGLIAPADAYDRHRRQLRLVVNSFRLRDLPR